MAAPVGVVAVSGSNHANVFTLGVCTESASHENDSISHV